MTTADRLQLLLPFPHTPGYDARDFMPAASNQEALAWLDTDWPDRRLALWGPAGCGKSHLLHIWAEQTGAACCPGQMLSEQTLRDLDGVPENGALALDDADTVARGTAAATSAEHRARPGAARPAGRPYAAVTLAGPPARPVQPAAGHHRGGNPAADDDLLAALLMHLLSDRQLSVAQPVQDWLLTRLPRSPAVLAAGGRPAGSREPGDRQADHPVARRQHTDGRWLRGCG